MLLTGPALPVVPAAGCSRAYGGCWPWPLAAAATLTAEPYGTFPGSARRRSRTEHPEGPAVLEQLLHLLGR